MLYFCGIFCCSCIIGVRGDDHFQFARLHLAAGDRGGDLARSGRDLGVGDHLPDVPPDGARGVRRRPRLPLWHQALTGAKANRVGAARRYERGLVFVCLHQRMPGQWENARTHFCKLALARIVRQWARTHNSSVRAKLLKGIEVCAFFNFVTLEMVFAL